MISMKRIVIRKSTGFEGFLRENGASDDEVRTVLEKLKDDSEKYEFTMETERKGIKVALENLKLFSNLPYDFKTREMENFSIYRNTDYAKIEMETESKHGTIIKGQYKCSKCGGDEISMVSKQLRRADEPETHLFTCMKCFDTWRIG